ncbi:peptidase [Amphritea opalescens]|uniref:Peptidase n=1 Tax=Amphritea opalescens TaxID=2490544 RepID=A0A430KVH4_9GAMM|nr:peptidase [Amphritea opalescens]RTE67492.1 peptidase [Amphritea opalescens]
MTYCVGIRTNQATIMISDSRTSAGVDNISSYSKMWRYGVPGKRQFVLCSAGNLATTQAVIAGIERDISNRAESSLLTVVDMHQAAEYIGRVSVEVQEKAGGGAVFESTFLLAGEILGSQSALYMIYAQGNFIVSSSQVPFLQIGETKYGKPMLDRVIQESTSTDRAVVCGLISMDATLKSNLTVGPPIELYILQHGSLTLGRYRSFGEDDDYMRELRKEWNMAMEKAVDAMPFLSLT